MAVWGAPVAQEDDAERAVRAALELVGGGARARPVAAGPRGRAHRRGGGHARRRRARAWSRATSSTPPPRIQSAAEPGHGARRRGDEARFRGRRRLRGRRRARAEGQGRASPALARAPRRREPARRGPLDARSRRRSSAASASSGSSRTSSTRRRTRAVPPALGRRRRRDRQVAARLGVREVRRRARRRGVVASRPLSRLRRGRRVLGARRDDPHARARSPRTSRRRSRCASSPRPSRSIVADDGERALVEPRLRHLLGLDRARRARPRRTSSPRGGSSSSG